MKLPAENRLVRGEKFFVAGIPPVLKESLAGRSDPQFGGNNGDRRALFSVQKGMETVHSQFSDAAAVDVNGCQLRLHHAADGRIIKAYYRQILGNLQPQTAGGLQNAGGNDIIGAKDSRRTVFLL